MGARLPASRAGGAVDVPSGGRRPPWTRPGRRRKRCSCWPRPTGRCAAPSPSSPASSAAGNAFCQAAQLHLQLQSKHDAATNFVDAGNAFKKADPQEAINCLIRAIEIYTDMVRGPPTPGGFGIAVPARRAGAERGSARRAASPSLPNTTSPLLRSTRASWWTLRSSANKCLLKVATYAAQLEQYQKAVEIYEQVGPLQRGAGGDRGPLPHNWGPSAPEVAVMGTSVCSAPLLGVLLPQKWWLWAPRCVLPHNWGPSAPWGRECSQKPVGWAGAVHPPPTAPQSVHGDGARSGDAELRVFLQEETGFPPGGSAVGQPHGSVGQPHRSAWHPVDQWGSPMDLWG
uniref:Uncharacterized protein n=1 Tax=Chrysolophus pictus TaxID=9089 RepID=A0A8C3PVV9_CHRPC